MAQNRAPDIINIKQKIIISICRLGIEFNYLNFAFSKLGEGY